MQEIEDKIRLTNQEMKEIIDRNYCRGNSISYMWDFYGKNAEQPDKTVMIEKKLLKKLADDAYQRGERDKELAKAREIIRDQENKKKSRKRIIIVTLFLILFYCIGYAFGFIMTKSRDGKYATEKQCIDGIVNRAGYDDFELDCDEWEYRTIPLAQAQHDNGKDFGPLFVMLGIFPAYIASCMIVKE